jgi:trans-aconitate methyltransferase
MKPNTGKSWDWGYQQGRFAFLHRPAEQLRLTAIARMIAGLIASKGACEVVDIGCGEGLLLDHLKGLAITRYIGLDLSHVALSRLPKADFAVSKVCKSLAQWDGEPAGNAPRILVASEVLYYEPDGVRELVRLGEGIASTCAAIVSCVAGHPGKPNWEQASQRLWHELAQTGWPQTERLSIRDSGLMWDIAAHGVHR